AANPLSQCAELHGLAPRAQEFGLGMTKIAEVAVGTVAIGVAGIGRRPRADHLHQRVPEACALEPFEKEHRLARGRLAWNLNGLASATQNRAHAALGGEGPRWFGIGEGREELAHSRGIRLPAR